LSLLYLLSNNTLLLVVLVGIIGLCVGSFLNVVIYRMPIMLINAEHDQDTLSLIAPRSFCSHCQHKIHWYHNIPFFSYLVLKGRCAYCHVAIPKYHVWVELSTSLLSALLAFLYGPNEYLLAILIFTWILIPLVVIDWQTQLLPDNLTFSLLWLGLLFNINHLFASLTDAILGAVSGYLFLWLFTYLYKFITKKMGMGHGDFKLLAAIGAWLGWQILPLILVIGSLSGLIIGISWLKLTRQNLKTPIAFGPYLAIAAWGIMIYHQLLLDWYLSWVIRYV
jgi:leader peptidase (prepilin peptidase)/N-methyltransferase